MDTLAEALKQHHDRIAEHLYLGYVRWDDLVARIEREEQEPTADFQDEQAWTFLLACGYAVAGDNGVRKLTRALTGSIHSEPPNPRIWLEVLPVSPRHREGETHVDLAAGTIDLRPGTESGIELGVAESPWVFFCEAKWYSDIATHVSHDIHRNQLARLIENALCFQGPSGHVQTAYVTLLTPAIFRDAGLRSRLYQYKFDEYNEDRTRLTEKLKSCALPRSERAGWVYPPDLPERAAKLSLGWRTFDELIQGLPDSPLVEPLTRFWQEHGNYQGRAARPSPSQKGPRRS